jgi:hypothetical protein
LNVSGKLYLPVRNSLTPLTLIHFPPAELRESFFKMKIRSLLIVVLTFCGLFLKAQTCSDVVSNGQNLVKNGNFSDGYSGWSHNPVYRRFTPCKPRCYSIPGDIYVGSSADTFNPDGFDDFPDHSATTDNMFLMIDDTCLQGTTLWEQNIQIESNTNYYFSLYVTSLKAEPPYGKLRFQIGNTVLPDLIEAPSVPGKWVKYTAKWNSGNITSSSIAISIQNVTAINCKSAVDFAIDDISFSPGCEYGTPGPLPELGNDFNICGRNIPFDIHPGFNAATSADKNIRYTWTKNGAVVLSGSGPDFYNLSVTEPGVYTVCVDSAGSCPRSDKVTIGTDYSLNVTPEAVLCDPTTAILDAEFSGPGVTYQWFRDNIAITGADKRTFSTTNPGDYFVIVNDPKCGQRTAHVKVKTLTAAPADSTYCPVADGGRGFTNLGVTGTGKYKWWSAPVGGEALGTGNSFTTPVFTGDGPFTYYVEDTSVFSLKAGPSVQSHNFTGMENVSPTSDRELLLFNALTDFRIDSITVLPYNYYCPVPPDPNARTKVNIEIYNDQNVLVGSSTYSVLCNGQVPDIRPLRVPVGIEIKKGTGYKMRLGNGSDNIAIFLNNGNSSISRLYPVKYVDAVEFTGNSPEFNEHYGQNAFPGYFDWRISRGVNCKRVPVQAIKLCPKCKRSSEPESVAADVTRFCEGTVDKIKLSFEGGHGEKLVWYKGSCGNDVIDSTKTGDTIVVEAPLVQTTYFARWEASGNCNSECRSVTVTPVKNPDVADAGELQEICNLSSVRLSANRPGTEKGTGKWSVVSGSVRIADSADFRTIISQVAAGENILKWTISNAPCKSTESTVVIKRDTLSKPEITGEIISPCESSDSLIYTTVSPYNLLTSYSWTGSEDVLITGSDTNRVVINAGKQEGAISVTQKYGICTLSDTLKIVPVVHPSTAAAGEDFAICNLKTTRLDAVEPVKGKGYWRLISGTGLISDTTSPVSALTGIAGSDLKLVWTVTNAPCPASYDTVTVHRDTLLKPVITGKQMEPCEKTQGVVFNTLKNNSPVSQYIWVGRENVTVISEDSNAVKVNVEHGDFRLIVTEKSGVCSLSDTLSVEPAVHPDIAMLPDTTGGCNTNMVKLTAGIPSTGKGIWTKLGGAGEITDPDDPRSEVTGLIPGNDLIAVWTIKNGSCEPSSDTTIVHVDTLTKPVLTGETFDPCIRAENVIYRTLVNRSPVSSYTWSVSADGTLSVSEENENTVKVNIGETGGYLWVSEKKGFCELNDMHYIGTTPVISPAFAGIDITICTDRISLSGINPLSGRGEWSILNGNGEFEKAEDAGTEVTGLSEGINSFVYTVYGCGGPLSDTININVIVSDLAVEAYGPSDTLCAGTPRLIGAAGFGGSGSYIWHWINSDTSKYDKLSPNLLSITPQKEKVTYYVFLEDSLRTSCFSPMDSVEIYAMKKQDLKVMNLVTPNHDGKNEFFIARDAHNNQNLLPETYVEIYNRWGSRVFESSDYRNDWAPYNVADGVYYYRIKAGCGGNEYNGWLQVLKSGEVAGE